MNTLLILASDNQLDVTLSVTDRNTENILTGHIAASEQTVVTLTDPEGECLYQSVIAGTIFEGLLAVLGWLSSRNIRVDLVVHRVAQSGQQDTVMRITPITMGVMADFPHCALTLAGVQAIAEAYPSYPQLVQFSANPRAGAGLGQLLAEAGTYPPPNCPHNKKVRCEACPAG